MPRYPNQDFQQNISFKCTLEFRFALKLAMEKAGSRDLSSFIRQHLEPAIHGQLDESTREALAELDSPVKVKEAARFFFRSRGAIRVTSAIRDLFYGDLPAMERRLLEISRQIRYYEQECTATADDPESEVLLRAALTGVGSDLSKILRLMDKGWSKACFSSALRIAADLPDGLSSDISNGLEFLHDEHPSIDRPYAQERKINASDVWLRVATNVSRQRKVESALIHSLEVDHYDGSTFYVVVPERMKEKISWLNSPRNFNLFQKNVEVELGRPVILKFVERSELPY